MDTLLFECKDMINGEKFPVKNTGRGQDLSPEFLINNLSPSAKTLAITLEDITHPLFKDFTHWLIWNLPPDKRINGAIPHGKTVPNSGNARQGIGYGLYRYAGPKPPKGKRHLYRFTVYVLNDNIDLKFPHTKNHFFRKARKHIIQQGSIVCEFE
ncbi:MAG: YbhB/YbcL family Raf kinase inhibitor-like protein [Eubacterium sp.]|jgi:Raf kinase inhibitor-like protein, YbhB/YbcL family|nr:YbhB/YbcL family Raf kinase inhibitor-like protein [Eubacterium sp.]